MIVKIRALAIDYTAIQFWFGCFPSRLASLQTEVVAIPGLFSGALYALAIH